MVLDELLSRRVVFLSGKGGVGKSVVGTALAVAAQRQGKRVLLVEVDSPLEASSYLGAVPSGTVPRQVQPGLSTVNLDPDAVMKEYVRGVVPVDYLARKLIESPVYQRFMGFAPGVPELITIGKIMMLEKEEERGGRPRYDLIVVDAPATGHGLAFLKVPQKASDAIPVGPIGTNARKVVKMLRDPEKTALAVVAIPEEMAVVEGLEFLRMARDEIGIHVAGFVLNGCHERRFTAAQESEVLELAAEEPEGRLAPGVELGAALAAARHHVRRRKLTAFYEKRLRRDLDVPLVKLPQLFVERMDPRAIDVLAGLLESA
jgi:anion-transporting  ArsA/GET3 family ATPase